MSQVYPLDTVIRTIGADYTTFEPSERIVIVDAKRRSIVPRKPLFSFGDLRYYLLRTSSDARNVANGQISAFQLRDLSYTLPVSLSYEVRCRPGNEMRMALALFDPASSPGEVLEKYILRWLSELKEQGIPEFVRDYIRDKNAIESKFAMKAAAEAGVDLNVRLFLDHERSLNPITVARDHLRVTLCDYRDEEQEVHLRATIDVDESRKANAILAYPHNQKMHEIVPRETVKYLREHVTMEAFCKQPNSPEVRDPLMRHLDDVLMPYGRKIGSVRLETVGPSLQFHFQKSLNVICRLHEYPEEVVISNDVQMSLRDIALFKSSNVSDLTEWLQKRLNEVIPQRLFGVKYIDVLIRFEQHAEQIKKIISNDAAAIGYEIKQLITVPDLEPIRLKEAFSLNTSGTFELRLTNFYVKLQLIVTARIPRLETVESHLNRLQNVPRLMEDTFLGVTRQYLHGIHPERFYMRFGFSDDPAEPPVEKELIEKIQDRLSRDFGAEVIEVVVKVGDTEIITRLRDLQSQICPFTVDIDSLHPSDATVVEGNFQVDMVDAGGWSRFQQLTIGMPEIRQLLEQHLYSRLQSAQPELIQFRDPRHHREFETLVSGMATHYLQEQFGLVVRVTNVRRRRTATEEDTTLALTTKNQVIVKRAIADLQAWGESESVTIKERLGRLAKLLNERTELAATPGAEAEVAALDEKIAEVRASLKPERLPSFDDVQRLLLPERAKDVTLRDLAQLAGLPMDAFSNGHALTEGEKE